MVASPQLRRLTVSEAVHEYLAGVDRAVGGKSLSPVTAANYRRDLEEFATLAGPDTILDDLTAVNIDDIVLAYGAAPDSRYTKSKAPVGPNGKPAGKSAGTMTRFRQSIVRLFNEALIEGWVEASPMPRTKVKPKVAGINPARKALNLEGIEALIALAGDLEANPDSRPHQRLGQRDVIVLRLLVECGLRVSELSSANRSDIEKRADGLRWLTVVGKGNKTRHVVIHPDTWTMYEEYLAGERPPAKARTRRDEDGESYVVDAVADAENALLLTWRGLRMKPRDIQYVIERLAKKTAGAVNHVTPHGLRHTCATLLLAYGAADIRTVKELLGHASVATTGIYLDTESRDIAEAVMHNPVTGRRVS